MNALSSTIGRNAPDFYCGNNLDCGGKSLTLDRPVVMGILNMTPDSFSDGGRYIDNGQLAVEMAVETAIAMKDQGATIIDIGGESTRPGAARVSLQQEIDRVIPVVELLAKNSDVIISVDTSSPELMIAAANAGAGMINDVRALSREGAIAAARQINLPVCLMHMQGMPATMQSDPKYTDVQGEVTDYLLARIDVCLEGGINKSKLLLDPGFGFGKTLAHNLILFNALTSFAALGYPLLIGVSKKSMLGLITGKDVNERLTASVVMAALAAQNGANILRVHDVAETIDALNVVSALGNYNNDT